MNNKENETAAPDDSQETVIHQVQETIETPALSEDEDLIPEMTKKKNKKGIKIAAISGISAAVLVGGGAAAYHFSSFIRNQVNLRIMKPEKYYVWVNEENSRGFAEKAADSYDKSLNRYKKGVSSSIELKLNITDAAKDELLDKMSKEISDSPESQDMLSDIINNVEDLSIALTSSSKKTDQMLSLAANLNGDSLLTFDLALDMLNPKLFMRYPELKEQWLCLDVDDVIKQAMESENLNYSKIKEFYQEIISDPSALISPTELKNSIINYTNAWNESFSDVDREHSEKLDIGDITVKYTVLDVDINSRTGNKIIKNFIKEASNDTVLQRTIIDKFGLISEKQYDSAFKAALISINNNDTDDDSEVSLKTYIDSKGTIRGFSLSDEEVEIFGAIGKKKDDIAIEFSVTENDTKIVNLTLNAKETGKEKYSGSAVLNIDEEIVGDLMESDESEDYTITMDFDDMSIGSDDDLKLTGDAVLNIPDVDPIELKFKGSKGMQSVTYTVNVDEVEYGDCSLIFKDKDDYSAEMPDADDSYVVDSKNADSFSADDYFSDVDYIEAYKKLYIKLGIDEDLAEILAEEAEMSRNSKNNDDDYNDYDDYNDNEIY